MNRELRGGRCCPRCSRAGNCLWLHGQAPLGEHRVRGFTVASKTSNCIINVGFDPTDGATQPGTGFTAVDNLSPGQNAAESAFQLEHGLGHHHRVYLQGDQGDPLRLTGAVGYRQCLRHGRQIDANGKRFIVAGSRRIRSSVLRRLPT